MRRMIEIATTFGLIAASGVAAAAPTANAPHLGVAAASQVGSEPSTGPVRGVPGGGYIAAALLAGVVGVAVLLFTQNDDADSN